MLFPWKKSYDQPRQHIKKQRHDFANKASSSQSYGFPSCHVGMWELDHKESWVLKNWCFWTVVLEKTLESPWTARISNQSILKEISPEYSLEGLMLKLKLQYFGHLMQRTHWVEKTPMLGKIEGRKRRGQQRIRWLYRLTYWMDMSWVSFRCWWWTGKPDMLQSVGWQSWTQLSDWTELIVPHDPQLVELQVKNLRRGGHIVKVLFRFPSAHGVSAPNRQVVQGSTVKC